jgi:hypothetical protein
MNTDARYLRLAVAVDYLIAKRQSSFVRPRLVVVHGNCRHETGCLPGESIESAHLQYPSPEVTVPVRLSHAGLIVCDCMVRFHHTPLSIGRIERLLTSDPFYRCLGANSFGQIEDAPKFTRPSLRVYVARLREQIAKAMREGGSLVSAEDALVSEATDSNVMVHRINLPVEIIHRAVKLMRS